MTTSWGDPDAMRALARELAERCEQVSVAEGVATLAAGFGYHEAAASVAVESRAITEWGRTWADSLLHRADALDKQAWDAATTTFTTPELMAGTRDAARRALFEPSEVVYRARLAKLWPGTSVAGYLSGRSAAEVERAIAVAPSWWPAATAPRSNGDSPPTAI